MEQQSSVSSSPAVHQSWLLELPSRFFETCSEFLETGLCRSLLDYLSANKLQLCGIGNCHVPKSILNSHSKSAIGRNCHKLCVD